MTNSAFTVTRFTFAGGHARPVQQTIAMEGVNKYDSRQVVISANVEGKEKPAHLCSLNIADAKAFVELLKAGIVEAKAVEDTTPAAWRARQAKEAKKVVPVDTDATVATLAAALGLDVEALKAIMPKATTSPVTPKRVAKAVKRGAARTSPVKVVPAKDVPILDDLEGISTPELEAVQNIMNILLGKRGNN